MVPAPLLYAEFPQGRSQDRIADALKTAFFFFCQVQVNITRVEMPLKQPVKCDKGQVPKQPMKCDKGQVRMACCHKTGSCQLWSEFSHPALREMLMREGSQLQPLNHHHSIYALTVKGHADPESDSWRTRRLAMRCVTLSLLGNDGLPQGKKKMQKHKRVILIILLHDQN